ncbi:tRNA modification GTPase TrmE [Candidatus Pantoea carbekii]|uniref:tRNA modification GTPase MnmE n=2 Tax=Candidatus Pantoea carbekii TaxID=1235990 RepID=U3U6Q9_9GAMM|nr:tRNA modification GTPase TrmE [Candidatus Pantoea carbekii]BAO00007.1 TrmE protein [Candidatus Pantoea carbekii]
MIDTIAAQATPAGHGGVGILRISGKKSAQVAKAVLGKLPNPRYAHYLAFYDAHGNIIDKGIVLWFPGPHSFTGEDVLELQGHGGPIILDLLLKRIIAIPDIRIANPGEFLERAFLNGKLDLAQAEAVSDLIYANSERAAHAAVNSLQGAFSIRVNAMVETLTNLRAYVETAIDFVDEEINFLSIDEIKEQLNKIIDQLNTTRSIAHKGSLLREGMKVVIAGYPNSGKSSLLNRLTGRETAIVTNFAGTTRDVLREHICLDGITLHIADTAGLRETSDPIEEIGIERAWKEIIQADHVLFMVDANITNINIWPDFITRLPTQLPVMLIRNKADMTGEPIGLRKLNNRVFISLSVSTGEGIDILCNYLKQAIETPNNNIEGDFLARRRHLHALDLANTYLKQCQEQLFEGFSVELLAENLRSAQLSLNEITGKFTSNNLLKRIFSTFCIGK